MDSNTLNSPITTEDLLTENLRLKAELKRQQELYEKSHLEVIRLMVESEQQSRKLKQLNKQLLKTFLNTIDIIQTLIDLREPGYREHSLRVAELSKKIARRMGLPVKDVEQISIAARIHEIGKLAIPESILIQRKEALSEKELLLLTNYPVIGAQCLEKIDGFRAIANIIKHIRENVDGSGRPDGLMGDEIPLGSRIIAIVDFFDTKFFLDQDIPSIQAVLEQLSLKVDRIFDSSVYRHLTEIIHSEESRHERPDERRVKLSELRSGMILSRDVITVSNVLLLPEKTVLDEEKIQKLVRYQSVDPIRSGIYVLNNNGVN